MSTVERSRDVLDGLKAAGVDFVASVPDINLVDLLTLIADDPDVQHVPVGREEEGVGVCTGAYLGGRRPALLMQDAGLMNSCNGLTTTALQFGIPILLLVYYAGDMGDNAFHMLGLVTEPVLQGLGIKYGVVSSPDQVKKQIADAMTICLASKRPVALLLTRDVL
ncbi:MAG TPA: thiamine pyrophosphate-binding protein [Chloroflexota bacterium]